MTEIVTIEWHFSPNDYFESDVEFSFHEASVKISSGRVEATLNGTSIDTNPLLRHSLHEHLNDYFLGVQLLTHKPYTLTRAHTTRVRPDGTRDLTIEVDSAVCMAVGIAGDIQVVDQDGNVLVDSRRDRIGRKASVAGLVSKHRSADQLLASLLQSHNAAVRDPANELVHLYEIREALCSRYGGDNAARKALSIGSTVWSRFGPLFND